MSDSIGRASEIKALAGFAILIPLLVFVWGHSVAGISLEITIMLSIFFLVIYFYALWKFYKKEL